MTGGIRPFRVEDAAACCEVVAAALIAMDGLNEAARTHIARKNHPEALAADLAGCGALVYEGDEGIVGMGALQGATVHRLYIRPEVQGRGVGTELLDALERLARDRRLAELHLDASPSSVGFYERSGFAVVEAEARLVVGAAVFSFVRMRKGL